MPNVTINDILTIYFRHVICTYHDNNNSFHIIIMFNTITIEIICNRFKFYTV